MAENSISMRKTGCILHALDPDSTRPTVEMVRQFQALAAREVWGRLRTLIKVQSTRGKLLTPSLRLGRSLGPWCPVSPLPLPPCLCSPVTSTCTWSVHKIMLLL